MLLIIETFSSDNLQDETISPTRLLPLKTLSFALSCSVPALRCFGLTHFGLSQL